MNVTTRAVLQTVIASDTSLSAMERGAMQRIMDGEIEVPVLPAVVGHDEPLLVTQKRAAEMLSVNRVTIWRMTKDCLLHPVEILPGTWRYPFGEIMALARQGIGAESITGEGRHRSAA